MSDIDIEAALADLGPKPTSKKSRADGGDDLARLAERMGYRYIEDLTAEPIDQSAWELVPHGLVKRHRAVPIGFEGDVLVVAVADPSNVIALDDIRTTTGRDLDVLVARPADIDQIIHRLDKFDRTAESLLEEAAESEAHAPESREQEFGADEAPIVKAINRIIGKAVQQRASDIHIEPQRREVRVRYRIDGVLAQAMTTKLSLISGMISRLKIMGDLDISEKRLPQDGRFTLKVEGRHVDIRVATMPTAYGEKCVLRILDDSSDVRRLDELGFDGRALFTYRDAASRPHGAVLLTGPTGSGKTSTLYATLQEINDPWRNIVTVEDPVEDRIEGLNQMQVNPKAGLTFANALRSLLRGDPDVLMVGEMRDNETAKIGIEAALTGHLVFATLHTNDSASAITRLIEMGIEPFLVASALECIVAQRLARRLCAKCSEAYTPNPEILKMNGFPWNDGEGVPQLHRAVGCNHCAGTGYLGRVAIVEVLRMTEATRTLTVEHRPAEEIKKQAIIDGMKTLREDGLEKALAGITTVEEVLRVVI